MLNCFGITKTRPFTKRGGRFCAQHEAGSTVIASQEGCTTSQQELTTSTLQATDSHATFSDLERPSSSTTDTIHATQAAPNNTTHSSRASDGATHARLNSFIPPQPDTRSARDPHNGATKGHTAEGAQHNSTHGDPRLNGDLKAEGAQRSSTLRGAPHSNNLRAEGALRGSRLGHAQHDSNGKADSSHHSSTLGGAQPSSTSVGAQHSSEPPSNSTQLDTCGMLDQAVSKVLANANVRQQEQHSSSCTSCGRQGVEHPPSPRSGPLPAKAACHTVTLASLEEAACSQAPDTPLALLVLGHQLGAGELWQLRGSGRFEHAPASKGLCDTAMAQDYAGAQGSNGAQLEDGIVGGFSAGSNAVDFQDDYPSSPIPQACKYEMGSCVWLNDAFSKRLEAPSRQAALTTINQSISSDLAIQRHIAGFCRNMAVGKEDPICFWSVLNPMPGAAQVEKICMWPCELLDNDGDGSSQQDASCSLCSAVLISVAEGICRDVQHNVLLQQHVAYQLAPCMVTVLSTQGCILTQNAESVAWLGCHSKEHSLRASLTAGGMVLPRMLHQSKERPTKEDPQGEVHEGETRKGERVPTWSKENPCGPGQAFCYLKELFYDQEDLMVEMQEVLGDQEPFVERMEIRSPLLRAWMGAGEEEEVWHRVHIIRIVDPITHQPQYCLSQTDVTDIVYAERHVLQLQEQQSALLKEILPPQVVEHLLTHRSDLLNCGPSQGLSPEANPAPASPLVQTSHCKPPTSSASRGSLFNSVPASPLGHPSHRKLPTPSTSRGSLFSANPAPASPLGQASQRKPPTRSISRGSLFYASPVPASPLGHTSHHKPPAPSMSRGSLSSQLCRLSIAETQHGEPRPLETARRMNHSSSARRAMRMLKNQTQDDEPSPNSLIPGMKVSRSRSLDESSKDGPPHPSTMQDSRSLRKRPTSLDTFRLSLTHSAGQQRVSPDGALLPFKKTIQPFRPPSSASILSSKASSNEQPSNQSQPGQDTLPGTIWLTQRDVMDLATFHDNVTILFADIKGFTSMVNQLHPSQVMLFLNSLYSVWDSLLETFGVYKVETIGDCYMCCTGLFCYDETTGTKRLGGHDPQHARTMLEFAKAMVWSSQAIKTPLGDTVQVRVGIHSGPCSSGVVGQRMPRFCLFGDTVNTANRMESNGLPGCIHASEATVKLLDGEPWRSTGGVVAKGKGLMQTSLLPVLPGAAHAAAAFIAQRRAANNAISRTGEGSSGLLFGSTCGEASTHGGQLQRSATGQLSSASGTSHCPEESSGPGQACEAPSLISLSPDEALLEERKNPTQHASPSLPGTEAAAARLPHRHCLSCPGHSPGNAESPLQQQQHQHQVSSALQQEAHLPAADSEGTAADSRGGEDEHQHSTLKTSAAQGGGEPALTIHDRAPSERGSLTSVGKRSAIMLGGQHAPLFARPSSTPGKPSDTPPAPCFTPEDTLLGGIPGSSPGTPLSTPALHITPQHSTAAQLTSIDPNTSQPTSPPLPPASLPHLCKSPGASSTGHGSGQGAWPTFEQGRIWVQPGHAFTAGHAALEQGHTASTQGHAAPTQAEGGAPVERGRAALMQGHTTEHGRLYLPQGAWAVADTDHAARLAGEGGEGEPCHVSESCTGGSGITLHPGSGSLTRRGDSLDLYAAGSAACTGATSITLNPGGRSGSGEAGVEEWESSGVWGGKGQEEAPGESDGAAARHEAADRCGLAPFPQQQEQHSQALMHAGTLAPRQGLPCGLSGLSSSIQGSATTSAEGSACLDVRLLSSLYAPAVPRHAVPPSSMPLGSSSTSSPMKGDETLDTDVRLLSSLYAPAIAPPPHNLQQQQGQQQQGQQRALQQVRQQQGQQQQQQGQGQVVQQELLPPPLQHQERSGKSDPGMAHPPSTPTSYSSQGSGGLTPLGGDVASMRAASENCRSNNPHCSTFVRSNSNFGRSQSRLGSSSAKRESSPAWVGWSKAGGEVEVEGLASVMDGCQRLVDSVTSRVLQQLQESRPELQARHAHPSDSRHGPWASRRSLDLCNNDMRRLSGSGKPGGAKLARKSRGATGHRDRNGSLSLDIPHPALAAAFPRQVSQPSPYAQAHTPPRGPSVQQSAPATAQQPVPGNIHP